MASLGGIGASFTGTNLSGGTAPPGRDFIDLQSKILTSGSLETFDVGMSGAQPVGETLQLKIWRINGPNYDFIGESQDFSSLVGGVNAGLTLTTPINVLVGDLISISLSDDASNIIETGSVIGAGIDFKTGDDSTSQPISGYANLADISLAVEVFGTASGGGDSINITSVTDFECKQRDLNGQALFTISGTTSGAVTSVEYKLDSGAWLELDASPTTTFTGNVTITGQQSLSVRFSNNVAITDTVASLTAALCIAAWGQSNQAGRGTNLQAVAGGSPIPIMYRTGVFSALTDATGTDGSAAGSIWPRIAQQYLDAGIPVCVANVAVGGTLLAEWQPATANYIKITTFADKVGGLEFSHSIIGEQDSLAGTSQATIETEMTAIVDALFAAYGVDTYIANHPEGDGGAWDDTVTKAAYANVILNDVNARFGGDLSVIDIDIATTAGNDGVHLKSDADLTTAGNIVYTAVNSSTLNILLSNGPTGSFVTVLDSAAGVRVLRTSLTYSSGSASALLASPVGSKIKGYVDDNLDDSANGAYIEGVTV